MLQLTELDWHADGAFLEEVRLQMLKFAMLQLRHQQQAEDAVQEAFVGALKNQQQFQRRAAFKSWIFAILKHKIIDLMRVNQRLVNQTDLGNEGGDPEAWEKMFDERGYWQLDQRPTAWCEPMAAVENNQFWQVFETCLNNLPGNYARAYMMREFLDLATVEICHQLGLQENNLNVRLYRARMKLRTCLHANWFGLDEEESRT